MRQTLKSIGLLIQRYLNDTGTKINSLSDETGIHYHTYMKVINGSQDVRAVDVFLVIGELMQRDRTHDSSITQQFFTELRELLDDSFDNC